MLCEVKAGIEAKKYPLDFIIKARIIGHKSQKGMEFIRMRNAQNIDLK